MSTPLLYKAYDSTLFKQEGEALIAHIANHLETTISGSNDTVIRQLHFSKLF